jgi:hypothetical protein
MWFWKFVALGCAGVLDLAAGALFVHLLGAYFAQPLLWWQYAIGAALGAAPDIDLFYAWYKNNMTGHHEYLTHRPIVGISLAIALGFICGGAFWATAAGVGVCWHYLHDTEGFLGLPGGGIAWCWPVSKKYLGMHGFATTEISWTNKVYTGDEGNDVDEICEIYLTPTRRSIVEFALTGIFLGYIVGDLFGVFWGAITWLLVWSLVFAFWGEWLWCKIALRSASRK